MRTLTTANSSATLTVPGVFPAPRNIEGYAVDAAFMVDAIEIAQTMMGVDARMSHGYVPSIKRVTFTLMPTSPSIQLFELWYAANETLRESMPATALVITVPSMERTYSLLKCVFVNHKPFPDAKKLLQEVPFILDCERIVYAPFVV